MDYRIFNMRTDSNACDCTRGCTDTVRESAIKIDSWRKVPYHMRMCVLVCVCVITFFTFTFFTQLYCLSGISHMGNSGAPGKASCDRVALPNLRCMLGVLVFLQSTDL